MVAVGCWTRFQFFKHQWLKLFVRYSSRMSQKKEDLDEMTNNSNPSCAPARAKQILWSPWGKLPPRGGGGLPQGGDDEDEHERIKLRVIIKFAKNNKRRRVWGQRMCL